MRFSDKDREILRAVRATADFQADYRVKLGAGSDTRAGSKIISKIISERIISERVANANGNQKENQKETET